MYVVSDSTLLHVPFPMADTALMRTSYTVPASRASRRVDVVEPGETGMADLQSVLCSLYSTWYSEMVTALVGAVQVTLRAGFPKCTALDTATPATWDGTIQYTKEIRESHYRHIQWHNGMYKMYLSEEVSSVTWSIKKTQLL